MRPAHSIYLRFFLPFTGILVVAMLSAWWLASGLMSASLGELLQAGIVLMDSEGSVTLATELPQGASTAEIQAQLFAAPPADGEEMRFSTFSKR